MAAASERLDRIGMIGRGAIGERVREWGLREDVVEKDYVLGWLLWGIGSDPGLRDTWVFKGGTCLKKCYIETYRFSEDLDFSVVPGGPLHPEQVEPLLARVLSRVYDESGIDFSIREPRIRLRPSGTSTEGRVFYQGPRNSPVAASVKLDLTGDEPVFRPPVLRSIAHQYPDTFPSGDTVRCYSFEELFAEKIRAMAQRARPRDLYDIVNLYRRPDFLEHQELVLEILTAKCKVRQIEVPSFGTIASSPARAELETEWSNMLAHQLPELPPFEDFWAELPSLFDWLMGTAEPERLDSVPALQSGERIWAPPRTTWVWGQRIPVEPVRFAAANRLCVRLGYHGRVRLVEPYSLRRSSGGNLLLYGFEQDAGHIKAYKLAEIASVVVTSIPFRARWRVELSGG